ncbi:MAG: type II toxin-antitoxin system VapC family toxin [Acidobacteriaceae bacterium]
MSFLLDTNVLSEPTRLPPDPGVLAWLASADEDDVFISAITIAEIRRGIQRLSPGKKRANLDEWLERDLYLRFETRILPVDSHVADLCGRLIAHSESKGRPMELADGCIAATALLHAMTLVTRNVSDFETVVSSILVPWSRPGAKRE